jgi:glycosyltransferase involved in cell wall biosynthesis
MATSKNASKTIVIDARYIRERPSGIGAMVDEIVRAIPQRMPECNFLLLRHPKARVPLNGAANVREQVVAAEANGPATLWYLSAIVNLRNVSLFHAPYNILPAGLRMPTVVTIHDVMWLSHPELCRSPGLWGWVETKFYQQGIRRALQQATSIIAISQATKDAIAECVPNAEKRVRVIHHGVDPAFVPPASEEQISRVQRVREQYAPGAERYVLSVGQSVGYKNQRAVLDAFLAAYRTLPGTHLVMVQRLGSQAEAWLAEAERAGAGTRVHIVPSVPFADLLALYQGAHCLCHPSFVEGWGMPITEAMGTGCPVVTSNCSAMPEVTAGAAVLVDPYDTGSIVQGLLRLEDPVFRSSLVAKGLARVQELSWKTHVDQTMDVYRSCLQ